MTYTEYWNIVSPLIRQIKKTTKIYLETMERGKGKVAISIELFNFIERFERQLGDIANPAYEICQKYFLENLAAIKEFYKKPIRPKSNLYIFRKGGE